MATTISRANLIEKMTSELLGFPMVTRAQIAERLLASLEGSDRAEDIEQAWAQEALRRYKDLKTGKTTARSASDVILAARQSLA